MEKQPQNLISRPSNQREVVLNNLPESEAKQYLSAAGEIHGDLGSAVPVFEPMEYYSFRAEYCLVGDDIQVQFFLPKHANLEEAGAKKAWMEYWLKKFPQHLDPVARAHFEAESPRLVAKWTEEVSSWWFRASKYSGLLDVRAFVVQFLEKLDASLRAKRA